MPRMRHTYLREAAAWVRGQTYIEDLPATGLLTGILLEANGTMVSNAHLATEKWRLIDYLQKVEIRGNGAQPIVSVDWEHLHYMNALDNQKVPPHFWRNYATQACYEYCVIPFGRFIGDPLYGLDLSRWRQAEIRLTNDASSTYFGSDLGVDVILLLMDDLPGRFERGYLRKEEFRSWATVQNAWEYLDLPTAFPLRGVHMQCIPDVDSTTFKEDTGMQNSADDVKFAYDDGRVLLFDGGIDHLMVRNYFEFPFLPQTYGFLDRTADKAAQMDLGRVFGAAGISGSKDGAVSSTVPTIEGDNQAGTVNPEAREADSPIHVLVTGLSFGHFVTFHYERECRDGWLLDPRALGTLTLHVHTRDASSAEGGQNTVVLDSVVAHPS